MILSSSNFSDNTQKRYAREFLVSVANHHFRNTPGSLNMFELLGGGIGADYYADNINRLCSLHAVERDKKLYESYLPASNIVDKYNLDICEYFETFGHKYDIINLDFCTYFCENNMKTRKSTGQIMRDVFSLRRFKPNSVIFVTFLLKGFHIHISDYKNDILTTPETIIDRICEIANETNIDISSLNNTFLYKPCNTGWNTMLHTGFVVNEM